MSEHPSRVFRIVSWVLLLTAAILIVRAFDFNLVSLRWPVSICLDASILRFESHSMLNGIWPWRDLLSINLPLTHYIHASGIYLFGPDDLGFRLLDLFWILTLAALAALYLRRRSPIAGWIGGALMIGLPIEATPFGAFQRETLMLPLWLIALWCADHLNERRSVDWRAALCFGVAVALAMWIKPTSILLYVLLLPGFFTSFRKRRSILPAIRVHGWLIVGGLLASTLVLLPLILSGTLLDFFVRWPADVVAYNRLFEPRPIASLTIDLFTLQPGRWSMPLNEGLHTPVDTGHFGLMPLFALGIFLAVVRRRLTLLLFLGAGLGSYLLQQRGFQYHLYPVWFGFNLVAAIVVGELLNGRLLFLRLRKLAPHWNLRHVARLASAIALAGLALLCAGMLSRQSRAIRQYAGMDLYNRKSPSMVADFRTVEAIGALATQLRQRGKAKPVLQTFENSAIALGSVSRYGLGFASRFTTEWLIWSDSERRQAGRRQLMDAMQQNPPDIVAWNAGSVDGPERERLKTFPELQSWLESNYVRKQIVSEINGEEYLLFVHRQHSITE